MMRAACLVVLTALAVPRPGAVLAQTATPPAEPARTTTIASGTLSGVYYQVGNALCRLLERPKRGGMSAGPAFPCGAMMTGGSSQNVSLLRSGGADVALVQSDVLDAAFRGQGAFDGRADGRLRALFSLHWEPYHLLVPRDLGLRGFDALKGRRVNLGLSGSATGASFATLMRRHGLTEASFSRVSYLAGPDLFSSFCEGGVEAFGTMVGYPNAAYAYAIEHCGGDLVSLDSEADRRLVADTPAYATIVIPRSAYPGLPGDVTTFGAVAVAAVTEETSDDEAYRIARQVFENLDDLRAMHPALASLDAKRMVSDGLTAPLHPGALRYFNEKGLK